MDTLFRFHVRDMPLSCNVEPQWLCMTLPVETVVEIRGPREIEKGCECCFGTDEGQPYALIFFPHGAEAFINGEPIEECWTKFL